MSFQQCIFCGKKPSAKNKEHILPKWLINLTGDPKRAFTYRRSFTEEGPPDLNIAFDQFASPACKACNETFSALEDKAKASMEIVLGGKAMSALQIDTLLDWFDKVRRSLWIAQWQLSKGQLNIKPLRFVEDSIAAYDRALIVYNTDVNRKRLVVDSPNPGFAHSPVSLVLVVNNFVFLNLSYGGLCSQRLGFPTQIPHYEDAQGSRYLSNPIMGSGFVRYPVVPYFEHTDGAGFYQPVYKWLTRHQSLTSYALQNFVREHSLSEGKGLPYLQSASSTWCFQEGLYNWMRPPCSELGILPRLIEMSTTKD